MKREDSKWWRNGYTREWWKTLTREQREAVMDALTDEELEDFYTDWRVWGRDNQLAPAGDDNWTTWLRLCGRGEGKTRSGSEHVRDRVERLGYGRICLLGQGEDDVREVMIEGEALWTETPIATPDGWTTMGALKVGDRIYAGDGAVTTVIAATPIWENRPCYRLKADGAADVIADARHLWLTRSRAERRSRCNVRESVRSTEAMADQVTRRRDDLYEFEIPLQGVLEGGEIDLPIPPYTLGAWLGDGDTRGHGTFTCHPNDAAIIERIREDGFNVLERVGSYAWGIRGLRVKLRTAGLLDGKRIPATYLRAAAGHRLELLRGLMDTDGYVSLRGQCSFDNTNLPLVEQVRELLLTLGYKPGAIQRKDNRNGHKTLYRLTFSCPQGAPPPFHLPRKVKRCRSAKRASGRLIREIIRVSSVPVRCIQVDHPSATFLAGEDMVVTHNSGIIACSPKVWRPTFYPSVGTGRLEWPNGAVAFVYSAADPEALRGPQFQYAWIDEPLAFNPEARAKCMSNLRFGLRLKGPNGEPPQQMITTTPKPHRWLKDLMKLAGDGLTGRIRVTRGSTLDNRENLSEEAVEDMLEEYDNTNLGRQELYAEILGDEDGALFNESTLDRHRIMPPQDVLRAMNAGDMEGYWKWTREFAWSCDMVVIGMDPNVTEGGKTAHAAGIVVAGRKDGRRFTIADLSTRGGPSKWGVKAITAYEEYRADMIVGETNQGGDLIKRVLDEEADKAGIGDIVFRKVHAWKGKQRRAEPVSVAYEKGKVSHLGPVGHEKNQMPMYKLEKQLCALHDGYDPTGEDFDRADGNNYAHIRLGRKRDDDSRSGESAGIFTFDNWGQAA